MRISVIAFDTRGGVQPYVALTRGLLAAGHQAHLITTEAFADLAHRHSVPIAATQGDRTTTLATARGVAEQGAIARQRLMRQHLLAGIDTMSREVRSAAEGSDLLIGGLGGSVVGVPVAEALGVEFRLAHLHPLGPSTGSFPGPLLPGGPAVVGRLGRRASHWATRAALRVMFGAGSGHARRALGLPRRPPRTDPGAPVAYGFSPLVIPPPPEWGPQHCITGYWTLEAEPGWSAPSELIDFLDSGPPPVCIGFGSMTGDDPGRLTEIVLEAVRRAGVRAVLLSGWGGLDSVDEPDVITATEAPHSWLFPRTAAVVHHGGAGTTGAALTAGVPAVVVPFGVDQPFWAGRVRHLGVGPDPIPRRRLDAERLARGLSDAVTDVAMRRRAADLGARIREEDGLATAVAHLTR